MRKEKEEPLWHIAQKRAEFRRTVYAYIVINIFFWLIWWFTTGSTGALKGYPWPFWIMAGWGIGLLFQYLYAYHGNANEPDESKNKDQPVK